MAPFLVGREYGPYLTGAYEEPRPSLQDGRVGSRSPDIVYIVDRYGASCSSAHLSFHPARSEQQKFFGFQVPYKSEKEECWKHRIVRPSSSVYGQLGASSSLRPRACFEVAKLTFAVSQRLPGSFFRLAVLLGQPVYRLPPKNLSAFRVRPARPVSGHIEN